jgi:hypothetical protein
MRSLLILLAGLLLLGAGTILGRLFAPHFPSAPVQATIGFLCLWLAICGFNLWVGVAKAGYAVGEELPVFARVFFAPAVMAVLLRWRGL